MFVWKKIRVILVVGFMWSIALIAESSPFLDDTIIVKFRSDASPEKSVLSAAKTGIPVADQILTSYEVERIERIIKNAEKTNDPFGIQRVYQIRFADPIDVWDLCQRLAAVPELDYVEPYYVPTISDNTPAEIYTTPNDPDLGLQYYLDLLQAEAAWDISQGSPDVVIAIVDNGTDWEHSDLLATAWTNPGEIPANGIDDDNNGYVDDVHGYDFYSDDGDPAPVGDSHGTHCAGLAGAVTDNGLGVASISWGCRIMSVRTGQGTRLSFSYPGIYYAAHNGADIISCSFGSESASRFNNDIVQDAYAQGAVIVAAAGNDGQEILNYPAGYDNVISVAATGQNDVVPTSLTNYGVWVDVAAPGVGIYNLYPNNSYGYKTGTSMSTPIVAGLCGLVKAQNPGWDNDQIAAQVILSADNIDGINPGYAGLLGSGRVNAYRALTETFDAIILSNREVNDQGDADGEIDPGEPIDLYLTLRSLFSAIQNVSVQLHGDHPLVTFQNDQTAYGNFAEMESITNTTPFQFTVHDEIPRGTILDFEVEITGDGYSETIPIFFLIPPVIGTHDSGNFEFTMTSEGELGFWKALDTQSQGVGFVYPLEGINVLFSGTFAVGTDPDYVVDAFFNGGGNPNTWQVDDIHNGFFRMESSDDIPQRGICKYTDASHPAARGLRVEQETWSFAQEPDRDFIILKYGLINTSTSTIQNLHAGIFMDWDIGNSSQDDEAGIDPTLNLVWQKGNDYDYYVGTALVESQSAANLSVIDNETYIYTNGDLVESTMYEFLSGDVSYPSSPDPDDYSTVCSTGPYSLPPNQSLDLTFIIAGGTDLDHLRDNIAQANAKFDDLLDVEISNFIAEVESDRVYLNWQILDSVSVVGFHIFRQDQTLGEIPPTALTDVPLFINQFTDDTIEPGHEYAYWIDAVLTSGATRRFGPRLVAVPDFSLFVLEQNRPNPFRTETNFAFYLPYEGRTTLRIYNAIGQRVATLVDDVLRAGFYDDYTWDRTDADGQMMRSGVYLYQLTHDGHTKTGRMVLISE